MIKLLYTHPKTRFEYEVEKVEGLVPPQGKTWIVDADGVRRCVWNFSLREEVEVEDELEKLKRMIKYHDLTYMYSDDGGVYRRGSESEVAINELIKKFPEEGVRLWNEMVDSKIKEGFREPFYKKGS